MKQLGIDIKWFYRIFTATLLVFMGYAATRTEYSSAHLVPHSILRFIGAPYDVILYAEQNINAVLHFLGAATLVWSLWLAHLPILCKSPILTTGSVIALCLGAELAQLLIGRGWQSSDLLLGIMGCFMAYLTIYTNKQLSS